MITKKHQYFNIVRSTTIKLLIFPPHSTWK